LETEAQARTVTIRALKEVTSDLNDKTLAFMYIEALKKISDGRSNKILFPIEVTKFATALSAQLGNSGNDINSSQLAEAITDALKKKK